MMAIDRYICLKAIHLWLVKYIFWSANLINPKADTLGKDKRISYLDFFLIDSFLRT